jgi:hypothetical protein
MKEENHIKCAKNIILPMLAKPILKEYLTVMFPQPEFIRFYAMQINKLNLIMFP